MLPGANRKSGAPDDVFTRAKITTESIYSFSGHRSGSVPRLSAQLPSLTAGLIESLWYGLMPNTHIIKCFYATDSSEQLDVSHLIVH